MKTTAPSAVTLFDEPKPGPRATAPTRPEVPAAARLVTTRSLDQNDRQQRVLLLLVVHCPYCDHQHIHPGGHVGAPQLGARRARCVGKQGGAYFFPVVAHQ